MRRHVKNFAEWLLGAPALLRRRPMRGRALVLAYHGIAPDDAPPAGEHSLHLRRGEFARQLDLLARRADVVHLPAALQPSMPGARPRVAITFDDAYQGAVQGGVAELRKRDMPATIFVAPAFLEGRTFWWDALAAAHGGVTPDRHRERALQELAGDDAAVRAAFPETAGADAALPAWTRAATRTELERVAADGLIRLASHTWSHRNLCALDATALDQELRRPREWLRDVGGDAATLAYPYGLNDARVREAARLTGYRTGLRVEGGWLARDEPDALALPRWNVPAGITLRGFGLRLDGLLAA